MLRGIHIVPCSKAISTVVENAAGVVRLDIYYGHVKMAALGCYVYALGKQTSRSPKCRTTWKATNTEFQEVQIYTSARPRVWLEPISVLSQVLEVCQNIWWKEEEYNKREVVMATYNAFPLHALQVAIGHAACSSPWNKLIHGLELFLLTTISPVLPTSTRH